MLRAAAFGMLISGCASNDQTTVTSLEYDDLALSVGTTFAMPHGGGELGAFGDVATIAHGVLPAGFATSADGTVTGVHTGLGYDYRVTCLDARHAPTACDAHTDAIEAEVTWTGSLELPDLSMTFERTGPLTLTGLAAGMALANGTATIEYTSRIANPDRGVISTYHLTYAATYADVAFDTAAMAALGGAIHYEIEVDRHDIGQADDNRDSERSYDVDATITLVGNGTAIIDLDHKHQYELTLATATIVRI